MKYLVALFLTFTTLFSTSIHDGEYALENREYSKAYEVFMEVIEDAANAKYNLGYMYELGLGVPRDFNKAIRLYKLAAASGSVKAQVVLGNIYFNGIGVKQDIDLAIHWFELANSQGDEKAKLALKQIDEIKDSMAELTIRSNIQDNEVYINGKYRGTGALTIKIPAGNQLNILVRKEGYKPFSYELALKKREKKTIQANLVRG